jgi:zinc D-Ala-D-Ala carboxypeptidase
MAQYKYFKTEEFTCKETGENRIQEDFIRALDDLREACGFPFVINSGYRSPEHSVERNKASGGGTHTKGIAADIAVANGNQRFVIVQKALELGFSGIGVAKTFIHVDIRTETPVIWSY